MLDLAPLVCPVAIRLPMVCGPRTAARMIFLGDGWGAGKPTGETPSCCWVAGPRAGAVRPREPAAAVSSDHHRARLSGRRMADRNGAQVTPVAAQRRS